MSRSTFSDSDLAYMRSLSGAVVQRTPRFMIIMLMLLAFVFISMLGWMGIAEIDVVVRGNGKVIPSRQLQVIQSLEGGVVSEILVKEGDLVEITQPLIKISGIAFSSSLEENRLNYLELRARISRLWAESEGMDIEPDEEVVAEAPALMRSEESLFVSNRQRLAETLSIHEEDVNQAKSELRGTQAKRRQVQRSIDLVEKELELKEPLVKRRLVSEIDFLQLRRTHNDLLGEPENLGLSIPGIESTIEQGKRRIEQARLDYTTKAKLELNENLAEVSRISESQSALIDRVQRTTLRAPVKGTITRLHINTLGGVIAAGGPIMEIVPHEDALLIEVEIKPADVANIIIDQPARLKFSAYDFAIYGALDAKVRFLSADTMTNEEGESFYVARLKPERSYLGADKQPQPIRVGMTVEADIITGKKTILEYLMKPINRGLKKALRES